MGKTTRKVFKKIPSTWHWSAVEPSQVQTRTQTKDCPGNSSYLLHSPGTSKMISMLFCGISAVILMQWATEESLQSTELSILVHLICLSYDSERAVNNYFSPTRSEFTLSPFQHLQRTISKTDRETACPHLPTVRSRYSVLCCFFLIPFNKYIYIYFMTT